MSRPNLYTIAPHRPFADSLAAGLLVRAGGDRMALARGLVLVSNQRSGRAIVDAFVRRAEGGLLLPRIVAIGDLEIEDRIGAALDPIGEEAPVPPAVDPLVRRMILARLVAETRRIGGEPVDAAEAVRLGGELARLIDTLAAEGLDVRALTALDVAPELSEHWQASLTTLEVLLRRWPEELARLGRIDPAERRNRLLDRMARRWRDQPPPGFVVAAGVTLSAPSVARLLATIAWLPEGAVVLPWLDLGMPDQEWDALGLPGDRDTVETHPQFHLKRLLDRMGLAREEVRHWRGATEAAVAPRARTRAIAAAMAPARFTGRWADAKRGERTLAGVRALEAATPAEEARAIALLLREAVETPGRTAALVTPDRGLAQRVSAQLRRWDIIADDSAGRPLAATPPGTLLLTLAQAAAERFAPVPLLAALKHPLAMAGDGRVEWLEDVRRLDRALRGPRPPAGLEGIGRFLDEGDEREQRVRARAKGAWSRILPLIRPLERLPALEGGLAGALALLREAITALAGDAAWSGPDGRALADLVSDLEAAGGEAPPLERIEALVPLLATLLGEVAVRPPQGGHPRIFIWGLIEARLQQADLVVLGGLNEGTWPSAPSPDPWLSPRVRRELGLPGTDWRIGVQAHDFALMLGAPRVVVTRSRREARAPAVASRLWLRLEAMTGGLPLAAPMKAWGRALDRPAGFHPASRPAPKPPAEAREGVLAVTALDRLKADPFAYYASAVLKLQRWDPVDAEPSPAWRGSAVHAVLEEWAKEDDCDPTRLRARAEALLQGADAHPVLRALWTPRLLEAIDWIAQRTQEERNAGRNIVAIESKGEAMVAGVKLHGKVDRIDRTSDGSLTIIDYKTGKPPGPAQVAAGYAMQLGLLGLIAERGGFPGIAGEARGFEYWSLAKSQRDGTLGYVQSPVGGKRAGAIPAEDFTAMAARQLEAAAASWLIGDAPFTAKLHPEYAPYGDYDQLMRLDEWYGRQDG